MKKFSIKAMNTLAAATALIAGLSGQAMAEDELSLTVWINGDKGYDGLQKVGDMFAKETGVKVTVAHPDDATDKFQQAAASGQGPDIFIWPHDRYGEWADSGLISELNPSKEFKAGVSDFWDAMSYKGKIYGYPMAVEAVGLIYNKDLLPTPPKNFEEIYAIHDKLKKDGKGAIMWDYNNTYFSWGLFNGQGGYPFNYKNGTYDVKDTGVNNKGSLMAAQTISDLIEKGVMPRDVDYGVMDSAFNQGEVAMVINGPWSWGNFEKSGINFGVTTIPAINGKAGAPFVGVLGATINQASGNKELAIEFIENYMLSVKGLKMINDDKPLGAVANKAFMSELESDENIKATFMNAQMGAPMPNVAEMGKFWSSMEPALKNITAGRQSVKEALDDAAARIVQ